jgi:ABC-type polysaccharide/polyol phosphate export permease
VDVLLNKMRSGLNDLIDSLSLYRLWGFWGYLDVRQRYRNTFFGPFWVTMTMAISILAAGLIYSYLFQQNIKEYLPYVATGFILWSLIAGFIGEACLVFIQNAGFISQVNLPYLIYPLRLLWRYIIFFIHHIVVLVIVLIMFTDIQFTMLPGAALGLIALFINIFWIGLLFGLVSVRFRDLPALISTFLQLLFMITPVIWPAKALASNINLAEFNPLYHLLECVRAPLLDATTSVLNNHLLISLFMAIVGTIFTLIIYSVWKRHLVYWL